jgi:hypothetical protein
MPFLISKMLSASNERARRLDNFDKTFSKDLNDMIARQKNEIRQNYSQEFNYELNQAEICAKNGDMLGAMQHKLRAEMMNDFLNTFG